MNGRASGITRRDHSAEFNRSGMRPVERSLASSQRSVRPSSDESHKRSRLGCGGCTRRSPHEPRSRLSASRGSLASDTASRQRSKFVAWFGPALDWIGRSTPETERTRNGLGTDSERTGNGLGTDWERMVRPCVGLVDQHRDASQLPISHVPVIAPHHFPSTTASPLQLVPHPRAAAGRAS